MSIQLSDHFTYKKLLKFTLPSIAMMIFTSIYGVVDGFFVSNFAGDIPFKAVNLIMPFLMIFGTVGFIFGTGGTAIVANILGEGDKEKANRYFSLFVYVTFIFIQAAIMKFDTSILIPGTTTPLIYPYFFVNLETQGVFGVVRWILILLVAFVVMGFLFFGCDKLGKKK